jgi:hypothetical protein
VILYNTTGAVIQAQQLSLSSQDFPIFTLSAENAMPVLDSMVKYSGNMSDVPYGQNLTKIFDPHDYVRLSMQIQTGAVP